MPSDAKKIALFVDGLPAGGGAAATGAATSPAISDMTLNRTVARMRACDITGALLLDEPGHWGRAG